MASYIDGMEGGKHNSDDAECSPKIKTYTVSVTFEDMSAKNPKDAAFKAAQWLVENEDAYMMIYDVIDEETNDKYIVDLSDMDDLTSVLPNN